MTSLSHFLYIQRLNLYFLSFSDQFVIVPHFQDEFDYLSNIIIKHIAWTMVKIQKKNVIEMQKLLSKYLKGLAQLVKQDLSIVNP